MADKTKFDFGGYATKAKIRCGDGRTIHPDAFKDCDGLVVPLVWQHLHDDPNNVLGHALLEHREDGMYAYGYFNDTPSGQTAKALVKHGDITWLSIFANSLVQKSKQVLHGMIREVSLVMTGANPGASIDNLAFQHDGEQVVDDEEAFIQAGTPLDLGESLSHAASDDNETEENDEETVGDIFDSFTDKQKEVVYAIVGQAVEEAAVQHSDDTGETTDNSGEDELAHSDKGETLMKNNVFSNAAGEGAPRRATLTRDQFQTILTDAERMGSFRQSFLAHASDYGIDNIEYLFPDARTVTPTPDYIKRETDWVAGVLAACKHSPFSRIKSIAADITADEARAKGYVKGNRKKEEVINLLKRTTTPQTIYKKQKLDRDDIIDITDFDVVVWLRSEMRLMLDEEIARGVLVSDGREVDDEDKIKEDHLRPIYTDDDIYAYHVVAAKTDGTAKIIEHIIRNRVNYKGSGSPTFYTTSSVLADMLLLTDTTGRRLYNTEAELASVLRVSKIVEVPVMENLTREVDDVRRNLIGIVVNLADYTIGADKGGEINFFDDFDIDYNQFKYLIETRISGCLTHPQSALVIEQIAE